MGTLSTQSCTLKMGIGCVMRTKMAPCLRVCRRYWSRMTSRLVETLAGFLHGGGPSTVSGLARSGKEGGSRWSLPRAIGCAVSGKTAEVHGGSSRCGATVTHTGLDGALELGSETRREGPWGAGEYEVWSTRRDAKLEAGNWLYVRRERQRQERVLCSPAQAIMT